MDSDRRLEPEVVADKTRSAFLDIARALAALLVLYTHIVEVFLKTHMGVSTWPTDVIDNVLVLPLKLDDQGIGAIAIPVFFLISGFVVTPIALRMGAARFSINRLLRIYPLLIFVVLLSAVLIMNGLHPLASKPPDVTLGNLISQVTLANFIERPFGAWVGVAWTIVVELIFYTMLVLLLPLLRTKLWLAIAIQLEIVAILLITYRSFGDEYRAVVINVVYTTIPIMGQAIWAAWKRKIPAWLAGMYVVVAWLLFVWAGRLNVDPDYIPRAFPIGFALALFLLGLFAEPYLRQRRFWTELSERTYSIYLIHGAVAFPLMHLLFFELPLWLTVLIAVTATGLAAELCFRFVERPSHRIARRLSRRRESAGATDAPGPKEPAKQQVVPPAAEEETREIARPIVTQRRAPERSRTGTVNGALNGVSNRSRTNGAAGGTQRGSRSASSREPAGSPDRPRNVYRSEMPRRTQNGVRPANQPDNSPREARQDRGAPRHQAEAPRWPSADEPPPRARRRALNGSVTPRPAQNGESGTSQENVPRSGRHRVEPP